MSERKISHTAPRILEQDDGTAYFLSRRFLGNLFPKNQYEHKELKAYIKGHPRFCYGRDEFKRPVYHNVRQEYYYIKGRVA